VVRNNECLGQTPHGGGLYHEGGAALLVECRFEDNKITDTAGYGSGGGVYSHLGTTMINCVLTGNTVKRPDGSLEGSGGGLYAQKDCVLTNCRLTNNSAQSGGGIDTWNLNLAAENCTITDNFASLLGGGVALRAGSFTAASFTNCILWGNVGGYSVVQSQMANHTMATVTYSCIQDAAADGNPEVAGTGNLDLDPMFVDPVMGDYHIQRCSPCVDAANTVAADTDSRDVDEDTYTDEKTPDLDRFPRDFDVPEVADTGVLEAGFFPMDMGAFEYQIRGDVNLDGLVNGEDIQPFTDCVLAGDASGPCQMADMNLDTVVDIDDIPCFVLVLLGDTATCFGSCGEGGPRGECDCNANGTPDMTDILFGTSTDCDGNLVPDECDIALCLSGDTLANCDCNGNGLPDACDEDCNGNGEPDECDVDSADPDGNGRTSDDCNANGIPDECEADCDENLIPDECDIAMCLSSDPTCQDCNENGVPDGCEADCNENGVPDDCDLDPSDPDGDGEVSEDCNGNAYPDECDLTLPLFPSLDCNDNLIPDECDIATCVSSDPSCQDCNANGIPDGCDIAAEISQDENANGIPDECEQQQMMGGGGAGMIAGEGSLAGGPLTGPSVFASPEAEARAWTEFYEWSMDQDWGPAAGTSGSAQFKATAAKLKALGLPLESPWR